MQFDKFDNLIVFKVTVYPQQAEIVKWLRASLEEHFGGQIMTSYALNRDGQSVLSGRITQDDPDELEYGHTRAAIHRMMQEANERADAAEGQERMDFSTAEAPDDEPLAPAAGAEPVAPPRALDAGRASPTDDAEDDGLTTPLRAEPIGRRVKGGTAGRTPEWATPK
jgi:hypothetical protein